MATVNPTIDNQVASFDGGCIVATWAGLAALGDVGAPIPFAEWAGKTFIITGTFTGTPTVVIEGSNDGVNWVTLTNWQGTALSYTATGIGTARDMPVFVRPHVTAGTGGAAITVSVACHRTDLSGMGR